MKGSLFLGFFCPDPDLRRPPMSELHLGPGAVWGKVQFWGCPMPDSGPKCGFKKRSCQAGSMQSGFLRSKIKRFAKPLLVVIRA